QGRLSQNTTSRKWASLSASSPDDEPRPTLTRHHSSPTRRWILRTLTHILRIPILRHSRLTSQVTYHTSNAYTVCNHPNPFVGQTYFGGSFELPQPGVAAAGPAPPCGEQKAAKGVHSDVNVHKDTLRLEVDELNPDQYLVSFVFDALVDGCITICYFAKDEAQRQFVSLFPETYVPIKVPFRKGLHQEFRQSLGTAIITLVVPPSSSSLSPPSSSLSPSHRHLLLAGEQQLAR
ncbi:RING/U-box superfamily protein, partial [Striga asiatica]